MKKVIRLKESQLKNMVKRIVSEQMTPSNKQLDVVKQCFKDNGVVVDADNFPKCLALSDEVMTGKQPKPESISGCVNELSSAISTTGIKVLKIGGCIYSKMGGMKQGPMY